jgi:diaminopimelate epimerase
MKKIPFLKVQSIGNDFLLFLESDLTSFLHAGGVREDLVRAVSDRHKGVGSDGVLFVAPVDSLQFELRMFNPDGTEDFCGNGIRCASNFARLEGWVGPRFMVHHRGHVVAVTDLSSGKFRSTSSGASYSPSDVPVLSSEEIFRKSLTVAGRTYEISSLSTGTTHTIILGRELPGDEEFFEVSPLIENHDMFPSRTSVIWTTLDSPTQMRLRIWERGVGETQGCGSGSTAAAAHWMRLTGERGPIQVMNPGGLLEISGRTWDGDLEIVGEAKTMFRGELAEPFLQTLVSRAASLN